MIRYEITKYDSDGLAIVEPIKLKAADVAAIEAEAKADRAIVLTWKVTHPELYTEADKFLTQVVVRKDQLLEQRRTATIPLYQSIKAIEAWCKPALDAIDDMVAHLKTELGNFRLAEKKREDEARAEAARAASAGDGSALVQALTVADDAAAKPAGRASVAFAWVVKRILPDLLPDEYWTPDEAKISAVAKAWKGDDPPVIPGVVFERAAKVGARK